jgi:AsmA-like C-terminal region
LGKLTAQGETNVQNAKVHGMELGYPISAQYDITDNLPVDTITIRKFALKLGSTPLEMTGTVNAKLALNGTMNLNFSNVKYSGADISHELASIAGFLSINSTGQTAQGVTNIVKMTGNILVKNGVAQTSDLQAQLDMGNVGAVGTANLATEALNLRVTAVLFLRVTAVLFLRVTAVLSQASSQRVGGQNVGGFMKTALANNQGELVIPALVTCTFSKPRFEP